MMRQPRSAGHSCVDHCFRNPSPAGRCFWRRVLREIDNDLAKARDEMGIV